MSCTHLQIVLRILQTSTKVHLYSIFRVINHFPINYLSLSYHLTICGSWNFLNIKTYCIIYSQHGRSRSSSLLSENINNLIPMAFDQVTPSKPMTSTTKIKSYKEKKETHLLSNIWSKNFFVKRNTIFCPYKEIDN